MKRAQKWCVALGVAATVIVLTFVALSDVIFVQYYLYELRSGSAEEFRRRLDSTPGTPEREAIERFVATPPGRERLLALIVNELSGSLNRRRPRARGSTPLSIGDLDYALCGMRYRAEKGEWYLWADMRWPDTRFRGSLAALSPSFASGEVVSKLTDVMCREAAPGTEVRVPEYAGAVFKLESFETGLEAYEAILGAGGTSIESTAYWYETLSDWRELLDSGALLPWVIRIEKVAK